MAKQRLLGGTQIGDMGLKGATSLTIRLPTHTSGGQ